MTRLIVNRKKRTTTADSTILFLLTGSLFLLIHCSGFPLSSVRRKHCSSCRTSRYRVVLLLRRKDSSRYDEYFDDDDVDDEGFQQPPRRMSSRSVGQVDRLGGEAEDIGWNLPSPFGRGKSGLRLPERLSKALLAGIFVLGIGNNSSNVTLLF